MKKNLEDPLQLDLFALNAEPKSPAKPKEAGPRKARSRTAEVIAFPTARRADLVRALGEIMAATPRAERPARWQQHANAIMRNWRRLGLSRETALADAKELTASVRRLTAYLEADGGWRSGQPSKRA